MCFRLPISVLLTLLFAASLCAQTDCRQRTVPITVFDRRTGEIIEPSAASFRASYRGKPMHVTSVGGSEQPPRVIVLLDVSGSMSAGPALSPPNMMFGLSIVDDLLTRFPQPTEIALSIFANKTERVVNLTTDRHMLVEIADSLEMTMPDVRARLGGRTALWDAVNESMEAFGGARVGDAIYAITDGDDNASTARPQPTIANLTATGIRLFRVDRKAGPPSTASSDLSELMRARAMDLLIQETGGKTTVVPIPLPPEQLPRVLDEFALQYKIVRNFVRLELELPEALRPSVDWKLELANVPGKSDLDLIYPRKLPACN